MQNSPDPHLVAIGTAVPEHEVHAAFLAFAEARLSERRDRLALRRMAARSGIGGRRSVLAPAPSEAASVDADARLYRHGGFAGTRARMDVYAEAAPALAARAVADLASRADLDGITHLVTASCTGFLAPGLDQRLATLIGLSGSVERVALGFMGCAAAVNGLSVARHIARSEKRARVLVVCTELCTLHLQDEDDLEGLLAAMLFGDGAAAALVANEETGLALEGFRALTIPETPDLITWTVSDTGFLMRLSGDVPGAIATALEAERARNAPDGVLAGAALSDFDLFAVHPGGRSVLDAVARALDLGEDALCASRAVLAAHGNMSSATILFVLARIMAGRVAGAAPRRGLGMAFGPGMVAETFRFREAA